MSTKSPAAKVTPATRRPAAKPSQVQEALDWAAGLSADEAVMELQEMLQKAKLTHQQKALILVCCTRLGGIQGFVQTKGLSPDVVYRNLPAPTESHYAPLFKR